MKANIEEYNGCFSIDLEAETKEETVQIVRMSLSHTKQLRGVCASFSRDGECWLSCTVGKKQKAVSSIG